MVRTFAASITIENVRRPDPPVAVMVEPDVGNTVLVEVNFETGGTYVAWDAGPVTVKTAQALLVPVFSIRATRTVGTAGGNKLSIL